jgi:hypothetical protein
VRRNVADDDASSSWQLRETTGGFVTVGGLAGVDVGWVQAGKTSMLAYSTIGPSVPEASTKVEEV